MQFKALVVDNNPVLLKAISAIIEQEGCIVETAVDGLQALEVMKTFIPDIVFSDLVMPLVDGAQLCKIIRSTHSLRSVYIVVISAIIFEETQRIMDEVDCDLCIAKGSLKELRTHIREALELCRKKTTKARKILGAPSSDQKSPFIDQGIASEILLEKRHREEIVACLSEGVIELNHQGKIVDINRAALEILGMREEQVIGLTIDTLGWGEYTQRVADWVKNELLGKGLKSYDIDENEPVFRDGRVLTLTLLAVEETTYFGICIVKDISRQFNAEEYKKKLDGAIRLVKKMEAMSGMAGGVAHDFNNLLTVICGNIDMVSLTFKDQEYIKTEYLLTQAKRSAEAAVELVRKISHFSAFGIISRENLNMTQVVRDGIASFFTESPLNIILDLEKGAHNVSVDQDQIHTALHNVLQNSVESGGGTDIVVKSGRVSLEKPLVESGQYVPAGEYAVISVTDCGKGIDSKYLVQIFDPYYSTKERGSLKGMGLGLTVVYATIRNHGGYVVVESNLGQGTTVSFYLPLFNRVLTKGASAWVSRETENHHVLLVEEVEHSRLAATVMLEYLGFEVVATANRSEAASSFQDHDNAGHRFAVALVNLPAEDSIEGVKICRILHDIRPELKVVATSGTLVDPVMEDCRPYGFVNTLPKPYTIDDLKNILSAL